MKKDKSLTQIGSRIRALRKERKMSLGELAKRSGLAIATLSRLQNGKASGTFRTHQRIAEALDVPISELYRGLEGESQEETLIAPGSQEAETFTYDENASSILLAKQISGKQMLPQLIILKPGGKTALEQYRKGTERWLFGLGGTVNVTLGEKNYQLESGGTLYFQASIPHQLINAGSVEARVISVTSPATV